MANHRFNIDRSEVHPVARRGPRAILPLATVLLGWILQSGVAQAQPPGRGGFDPSSFLTRLDTNGNGVLDPDEQQGRMRSFIERLQSSDPSIQVGKPIPLAKIGEAFQKMRSSGGDRGRRGRGRGRGRGDDGDNDRREWWKGQQAANEAMQPELLVPGFGEDTLADLLPLLGFGPGGDMVATDVTDSDREEAAKWMERTDRNKDGFLVKDEIPSYFTGNPMDFDRNRDGRLTKEELSIRFAFRREAQEEAKRAEARSQQKKNDSASVEPPDVYGGRKSYRRTSGRSTPEGLPGYFLDKDADKNLQVTLAEFASPMTEADLVEFMDADFNRDGIITANEAIRKVEKGGASQLISGAKPVAKPAVGGKADEKYLKYAKRLIDRYDKDEDGELTASEWSKMLMSPADADANRDARISVNEYALWMQSRDKK